MFMVNSIKPMGDFFHDEPSVPGHRIFILNLNVKANKDEKRYSDDPSMDL